MNKYYVNPQTEKRDQFVMQIRPNMACRRHKLPIPRRELMKADIINYDETLLPVSYSGYAM